MQADTHPVVPSGPHRKPELVLESDRSLAYLRSALDGRAAMTHGLDRYPCTKCGEIIDCRYYQRLSGILEIEPDPGADDGHGKVRVTFRHDGCGPPETHFVERILPAPRLFQGIAWAKHPLPMVAVGARLSPGLLYNPVWKTFIPETTESLLAEGFRIAAADSLLSTPRVPYLGSWGIQQAPTGRMTLEWYNSAKAMPTPPIRLWRQLHKHHTIRVAITEGVPPRIAYGAMLIGALVSRRVVIADLPVQHFQPYRHPPIGAGLPA